MVTNVISYLISINIKDLWTYVAQHAAEVQRWIVHEEDQCSFEFATVLSANVKERKDAREPRFRPVLFLGYAPGVTNGYYVLHTDGRVGLTSDL